jgi:hydrogenase nickel insertion protein HypA
MHEFSMTNKIVQAVLDQAEQRGANEVVEVHLVIGELSLLGIEQMKFSYKVLVENTIMERSRLFITQKPGKAHCDHCGYEGSIRFQEDPIYHVSFPTLSCPRCESTVHIIEGRECVLESVKLRV